MADDNNQDLSMEDILSSIKDILTEDEKNQGEAAETTAKPSQPDEQPAEETAEFDLSANLASVETSAPVIAASQPEEEIIDLSPSMRIEDDLDMSAPEINLDAELDNINPGLDDIEIGNGLDNVSPFAEDADSDPVYNPEEDVLASIAEINDIDSDPFDAPADPVNENVYAETVVEPKEVRVEENLAPAEIETEWHENETLAEDSFVESQTPVYEEISVEKAEAEKSAVSGLMEQEPLVDVEADPVFEPEYEAPVETITAYKPEPNVEAPEPEILPVKEEAVDVSASIISNFAKMFSKVEEQKAEPFVETPTVNVAAEPVPALGDGSKTIEGIVADVIRQLIGSEVAQNWRSGADYDALAREEIARQTNQWLGANLPGIVEQIVKKEIERVMAKVGS